jgi:hypothetical protein
MRAIYKRKGFFTAFGVSEDKMARRRRDQKTAQKLVAGGIDEDQVYKRQELVVCYLTPRERPVKSHGRLLRNWNGFDSVRDAKRAKIAADYREFCRETRIKTVTQLVLRRAENLDQETSPRVKHARESAELTRTLGYARKKFPALRVDLISAELGPQAVRMGRFDWHFHILIRLQPYDSVLNSDRSLARQSILEELKAYLIKAGWIYPEAQGRRSPPPCGAAQAFYIAKGLPHVLKELQSLPSRDRAQKFAKLFRETRGLAMLRTSGEFREWRSRKQKLRRLELHALDSGRKVKRHKGSGDRIIVLGIDNMESGQETEPVIVVLKPTNKTRQDVVEHLNYLKTSLYPRNFFMDALRRALS